LLSRYSVGTFGWRWTEGLDLEFVALFRRLLDRSHGTRSHLSVTVAPSRLRIETFAKVDTYLIRWGRRRGKLWIAFVLPGLLLRALIPLGFMPMFGPNFGVQLTLCEGYAPVPSMAMDMSMDMPMDMPMPAPAQQHSGREPNSGNDGAHSHQDHSTCPYGASPTLAALAPLTAVPESGQTSATLMTDSPQVAHFELEPRAQSPRGPPLVV
jgi:hypothetical protein